MPPALPLRGQFQAFEDVWLLNGLRTPFVDYCGALAEIGRAHV